MKILRSISYVILALTLSGCISFPLFMFQESGYTTNSVPPYLVMLTNGNVYDNQKCTGFMYDMNHGISAFHCFHDKYYTNQVLSVYGQETTIQSIFSDEKHDLVIFKTKEPVYAERYAEFAIPEENELTVTFGFCPLYLYNIPRYGIYKGAMIQFYKDETENDEWNLIHPITDTTASKYDFNSYGTILSNDGKNKCPGDSGGFSLQNNKVIMLTNLVHAYWYYPVGDVIFGVRGDVIKNFIDGVELN